MSTQNQISVPVEPMTVPVNTSTVPIYPLLDPSTVSVKRKRGRPRKLSPKTIQSKKTYSNNPNPPINPNPNPNPNSSSFSLLGKSVHGTLDGRFDSGYLITVRVTETGTVLKGLVFDPSVSVPVSKNNDVAPLLPMVKRINNSNNNNNINNATPVPVTMAQPLQMREPGQIVTRHAEGHTGGKTQNPRGSSDEISSSSEGKKIHRKGSDSELTKLSLGFSEQSADKVDGSDQNAASKPGDEMATPGQVSEQKI